MSPLKKFAFDVLEGAVYGAAIAALALPDGFTDARAAVVVIVAGAIGGAKAVARVTLTKYVASKKPAQ